jgi:hypothetical protein
MSRLERERDGSEDNRAVTLALASPALASHRAL